MPTRVLLIDPEESVVEGFAKSLVVRGFEVVTACNMPDCLRHLSESAPQVVVLEPDAIGSWGRQLLETRSGRNIPFIVVSRFSSSGTDRCNDIPWLIKPVASTTLVAAVQSAVAGRSNID